MKLLCTLEPQVRLLYDMHFRQNAYKRRAVKVRSHEVPPDQLTQWIQVELQNLTSHRKRHRHHAYTSAFRSPGLEPAIPTNDKAAQPIITDALASEQNDDTSAKMYTARTFTQAILHCHGPMSRPTTLHCYPGRCKLSCNVVSSEG